MNGKHLPVKDSFLCSSEVLLFKLIRQNGKKVRAISVPKAGFNQVAFVMRGFESIFPVRKKDGMAFNRQFGLFCLNFNPLIVQTTQPGFF